MTIEDDAGNHSWISVINTITVDSTPPVFSEISLIAETDQGVDKSDRYTAILKPVISFESESGLKVYVEHDNGQTKQIFDASKYTVSGGSINLSWGHY